MVTEIRPTLVRRQLGRRLRRLREQSGRTMEDVITSGVVSRSKLWRLEAGRCAVKPGDVLVLTRLYGTEPAVVDELLALTEATKGSGYLENYGTAVPESVGLYAELEASAAAITAYNSELIPGLLQTPDYARAVIEADRMLSPAVVDQRLAFRIERQQRHFAHPGAMTVIITAGAMNLQVGSVSVMEEQIAHLRAVDNKGAARISVLPATDGVHPAMLGPFVLLDFDDEDDPSVVYLESLVCGRYIEKPADVARYRQAFHLVGQQALPLEEWLQ